MPRSPSRPSPCRRRCSTCCWRCATASSTATRSMHRVEELTDGAVRMGPGTLYGAIKRMLADGLIEESDERPDPALDDQRRRYYRITARESAPARPRSTGSRRCCATRRHAPSSETRDGRRTACTASLFLLYPRRFRRDYHDGWSSSTVDQRRDCGSSRAVSVGDGARPVAHRAHPQPEAFMDRRARESTAVCAIVDRARARVSRVLAAVVALTGATEGDARLLGWILARRGAASRRGDWIVGDVDGSRGAAIAVRRRARSRPVAAAGVDAVPGDVARAPGPRRLHRPSTDDRASHFLSVAIERREKRDLRGGRGWVGGRRRAPRARLRTRVAPCACASASRGAPDVRQQHRVGRASSRGCTSGSRS